MTKPREGARPKARTVKYSQEIGDYICEELMAGRSMWEICAEDENTPSTRAVAYWVLKYPDFAKQVETARLVQVDTLMDESITIADGKFPGSEDVRRAKLMFDARVEYAKMIHARKYGPRQQLEHSGTLTLGDLVTQAWAVKAIISSTVSVEAPKKPDDDA